MVGPISSESSFVPLFVLCLRVTVGAQAPPLLGPPDSAAQAQMLAHLKAFASEFARNIPSFSCVQRSSKNSDTIQGHFSARSVLLIDLVRVSERRIGYQRPFLLNPSYAIAFGGFEIHVRAVGNPRRPARGRVSLQPNRAWHRMASGGLCRC